VWTCMQQDIPTLLERVGSRTASAEYNATTLLAFKVAKAVFHCSKRPSIWTRRHEARGIQSEEAAHIWCEGTHWWVLRGTAAYKTCAWLICVHTRTHSSRPD
jgi:hypothetical protein